MAESRLPMVANGWGNLKGAQNGWGLLSIPPRNPALLHPAEDRVPQSPVKGLARRAKIKAQQGDSPKQPNLAQTPSPWSVKTWGICSSLGCFAPQPRRRAGCDGERGDASPASSCIELYLTG